MFKNDDRFQVPHVEKNYFHSYHLYPLLINFDKFHLNKKKLFFKFNEKKNIFTSSLYSNSSSALL